MTEADVVDIARDGIWVMLKITGPALLTGLAIGLVIALFQALTQIQEMTLVFVPKIVVVFLTLMLTLPFMLNTLIDFTREMLDRVVSGG